MLRGCCEYCNDFIVVNNNLECVDTHEEPDGRGQIYLYTSKKGNKRMLCPDCYEVIIDIATDVSRQIVSDMLSNKSKKK